MEALTPDQGKDWGGFWHKVRMELPTIFVLTMLVSWMGALGWFRGFETWHLDTFIRLRGREMSQNISIVEITDKDYVDFFGGTSPLDKSRLLDLIRAVQSYNPSVIGVDIDTKDWGLACVKNKNDASIAQKCGEIDTKLNQLRAAELAPPGTTKKRSSIVWAAVPKTLEPPLQLTNGPGSLPLKPDSAGIPRFPVDEDGSVRHFERRVEVAKGSDGCPGEGETCYLPTFAQAILQKYKSPAAGASDERVIFNFYGDRYRFPIIDSRQFLVAANPEGGTKEDLDNQNEELDQSRRALFDGKIVLIGGSFVEARDEYFTPIGPMQGVELNALAIQTDLSGGGIRDINQYGEFVLDLCISIFIVAVFYFYGTRPWVALGISSSVVPLALISSLILFDSFAYWFSFIPIAVGLTIHQLTHLAEEQSEAQKEVQELQRGRNEVEIEVARVQEMVVAENGEVVIDEVEVIEATSAMDKESPVDDPKVKGAAGGAG
jgi:CHASE2 domain-containing sensor protein